MELGLPEISKEAIEQMRDHAVIQDDEFAVSFLVDCRLRGLELWLE